MLPATVSPARYEIRVASRFQDLAKVVTDKGTIESIAQLIANLKANKRI
jgi:hypothetical protein